MKVTKQQRVEFIEAFKEYAKLLGVGNWEVRFELSSGGNDDAGVLINLAGRQVTVNLNEDVTREDKDGIRFLAAHEAIELLLGPARIKAMDRYTTQDELNSAFHQVVQAILKLLGFKYCV